MSKCHGIILKMTKWQSGKVVAKCKKLENSELQGRLSNCQIVTDFKKENGETKTGKKTIFEKKGKKQRKHF